jgi:phage gp29-like protein
MARNTQILDQYGEPVARRMLTQEIAAPELAGVRTLWHDSIASGLTPQRLASILQSADQGNLRDYLTLAEEMEEREPHYTSVLGTRKRALSLIDPIVEAGGDSARDREIFDAVMDLIGQPVFADLIEHLVDAFGKGYAVSEIMWETSAKQWLPYDYRERDPRFFTFMQIDRHVMRLASLTDPINGDQMPPFKFVRHVPRLKSGIPARGGLAKPAAWSFVFKSYTIKDWVAFCEVYGMPIRIGKYGAMATPEDRAQLLNAVRNIGSDAAAIIPATMEIELVETGKGGGSGATVFSGFTDYIDKQMSKLVLGQTMTTDHGGSLAQAKVHENVRHDIMFADARQLQKTINRDLIIPFVQLNYGPQKKYPTFTLPVAKPEDLTALAGNVKTLVSVGVRISESDVRDRFGFNEPEEGETVLGITGLAEYDPDEGFEAGDETDADATEDDGDEQDELEDPAAPIKEQDAKPPKPRKAANKGKARNSRQSAKPKAKRKGKPGKKPRAKKTPAKAVCKSCGVAHAANASHADALDGLTASALGDWERVADPMLKPIRDLANNSASYEEFLAGLGKAMTKMDAGRLVETLAAGMAIARGLGNAGVKP